MHQSPLERAIIVAGSQSALARSLGVSQTRISQWLHRDKKGVAPEFVIPIELRTGVSRHELRPDLYPQDGAQ